MRFLLLNMKYKIFLLALQFFDVYFTDLDPEFLADPDPEKNPKSPNAY